MTEESWKLFGTLVPIFGGLQLVWTVSVKELRRLSVGEKAVGPLGRGFWAICRLPLQLSRGASIMLFVLSGAAFIGGFASTSKNSCWVISVCHVLFNNTLLLVLAYVALAFATYFQIIPKFLYLVGLACSWISSNTRYSPGMINADWLLQRGEDSPLLNISPTDCEIVGSFLFRLPADMVKSDYAGSWTAPTWGAGSRANALLIGCIIEGVIHNLPKSAAAKAIQLAQLYTRLRELGEVTWRPSAIVPDKAEALISRIATADAQEKSFIPAGQLEGFASLREEEAVLQSVTDALRILGEKYYSDASELAIRRGLKPSLRRARANLQNFPQMNSALPNAMDVQFLKLAVAADVWPSIRIEKFIYPFSRGLAMFLANTGCLVPTPETKEIIMDDLFRRLVASAEQVVVDSVAKTLRRKPGAASKLGIENADNSWRISREVDYRLWWLSRKPRGWELNLDTLDRQSKAEDEQPKWSLAGNALVRG